MNDPVLDRAMFRNQAPVSSYGTGITSNVASPDEAARALQMAFQPTGYAGGGQVINGVKHFKEGGENQSGGRSFLGGMFRLPDPETVLAPRRYTSVQQAREDAAALEPATQPMNPEDVIVPRRYGTVRSGFYRAGEGSSTTAGMEADPNFDLPPSEEWNPESQFGRDVKGALPKRTTDEEAKDRLKAISDEVKRKRQMMENVDVVRNAPWAPDLPTAAGSPIGDYFRSLTPEQLAKREADRAKETADRQAAARLLEERLPPPAGGIPTIPGAASAATPSAPAPADTTPSPVAAPPVAASPSAIAGGVGSIGTAKKPDEESGLGKRLSLRIDELKQEREANKAQQKENQLLALMQAGFAAAAGKSSSAITNIGAGGAAGIATLADLEKTRRSEDTSLRKESLDLELAKEKMIESAAERRAQQALSTHQREQTLLQNVSTNARQEVSGINSNIAAEEAKLLGMGLTDEQKVPIKNEIARLKNQRDAANEQLYSVLERMGVSRPRTPEQTGTPPKGANIVPLSALVPKQ